MFLHSMNKCSNIIVRQCMFNALQNVKNIIGRKFVFYRFGFYLLDRDLKYCIQRCKPASLSTKKLSHVNCVHTLSLARSNHVSVEGFDIDEIHFIIDYIATG